jgi:hypothetical protein
LKASIYKDIENYNVVCDLCVKTDGILGCANKLSSAGVTAAATLLRSNGLLIFSGGCSAKNVFCDPPKNSILGCCDIGKPNS